MSQLKLLADIFGSFFETVIIYYYTKAIFRDCKISKIKELMLYIMIMIFLSISVINYPNTLIIPITFFILTIFASIFYEGTISLKIITNLLLTTFLILSEVITAMLMVTLTGKSVEYISNNIIYYLQGVLVSKLLVFIVTKTYEYKRNTNYSIVPQKILIPLVLMPISSILVIYIISEKAFITTNTYNASLIVITISLLITGNIFIFYLFEKQLKQEEEKIKTEFFKKQIESQKKHFEELTENQRRINKAIHDTKNQLLAILGYIEDNQNKLAIENLNLLCDNITGECSFINTGNLAIDSLLNAKIKKINNLGITLETFILLEQNNQVEEIDLCIILGNALDNAIEACEKIPIDNEKKIQLKIIQVEEHLSIVIINSIYEKTRISKYGITTTKKDKLFHGFGLGSMRTITEKYNGHINYEQEENNFTVNILLQNLISCPKLQI